MFTYYTIGLYRENAIAVESEASGSLMWTRSIDQSGFARKERNLHCDVHVASENRHILPPFGSLDSFWITRSQRSRRRDKGLCRWGFCFHLVHMRNGCIATCTWKWRNIYLTFTTFTMFNVHKITFRDIKILTNFTIQQSMYLLTYLPSYLEFGW